MHFLNSKRILNKLKIISLGKQLHKQYRYEVMPVYLKKLPPQFTTIVSSQCWYGCFCNYQQSYQIDRIIHLKSLLKSGVDVVILNKG